jgi:hypothetical protein
MWFKDFLKRHKKYIKHKKTKGIEMVRVRSVEEEDLDAFLAAAQQLFDQHQFVPDLIINADESPVDAMRSQPSKRLTTSTNSRASVIQGENEKLRTILPFIAASGRVWMVVLIFICGKSEDDEAEREVPINTQLRKLRGSYRFFMLGQKKEFINTPLWIKKTNELLNIISPYQGGKSTPLLTFDRHTSHLAEEAIVLLLENNVHTLLFPPHTTHWLQPFDDMAAAALKKTVKHMRDSQNWSLCFRGMKPTNTLASIIINAVTKAFTPEVIKASFKNTGIYPFDKEKNSFSLERIFRKNGR